MLNSIVFVVLHLAGITTGFGIGLNDDEQSNIGSFWQLTDIHYDANYSSKLIVPNLCALMDGFHNSSTGKIEMFGDYSCDAPWALTVSAIEAMKQFSNSTDFILWTGDSIPHISDDVTDQGKNFLVIKNVTEKLLEVFPSTPVYPMIGNHDVWPAHQMPITDHDQFYKSMITNGGWSQMLDPDEQTIFLKGGYYSKLIKHDQKLRLVCLNSNIWYNMDKISKNVTDPSEQFHWLELEMQKARHSSEKVLLAGHVPPGTLGRVVNVTWMQPLFNQRLHWLLQRYDDIITAAIFGHEHSDSFRIVYNADGNPTLPIFLAPAVTPWNSSLPGMGANNPSIRLYHYSRNSGKIIDYTQYFLNLSQANVRQKAVWSVEYRATKAYDLKDMSPASLNMLVQRFKENKSDVFQAYYRYNSVSYDNSSCVAECKQRHICSITKIDISDYNKCLHYTNLDSVSEPQSKHKHEGPHDHPHHEVKLFTYYLLGALLILLVILFLIIAFCCCRRRHAVILLGRSKYIMIQEA